jgi:arginyl-tRNA--protein-N-Asp/Glu arginylyltransferase
MDFKLELVAIPVTDVTELPWSSFVFFEDPDGNRWALQQLPVRA